MWGNFKNYLGQYYPTNDNSIPTNEDDDVSDWVIVDKDGNELRNSPPQTVNPESNPCRLSPLPLLDISNTSSPQTSPQLSPTKIEEGWLVAPPPCFIVDCPGQIESSPLENLLIEHPSMSVYARIPDILEKAGRSESVLNVLDKIPCQHQAESVEQQSIQIRKKSESGERKTPYDRPDEISIGQYENTESGEACTYEPGMRKKSPLAKTRIPKGKVTSKMQAVKSDADLKNFIDQIENAKPAQQAKWERDQFQLCPSYLNRQNRVHRYQSRKHHNQKKKSIAKPFAEKCGHSF